jgi:hypothetical protein
MTAPSLRVQTVLYDNPLAGVGRLVRSLDNAVGVARRAGIVGTVSLHLGDCSGAPSLSDADVAGLRASTQELDSVRSVHFGDNLGHGGGQNRLAEDAAEDFLLVVNPDAVAEPLMVAELVRRFADPGVAVVEARQVPVEHPKEYDPGTGATPWASMACAMLRLDAVRAVGLFDAESFFLHGDDVDLSWRMRLAGWSVVHQATARVFHDKAVGPHGYIAAGPAELVHGPLGSLLLAYKYSRDDQVEALGQALQAGSPEQRAAWAAFEDRRRRGALPAQRLDPEGHVARFVQGNHALHRF